MTSVSDSGGLQRAVRITFVALALALCCAGRSSAAEPSAADRETARALMEQGIERMQARDPVGALKAFRTANEIMHVPTTALATARAHDALGQLLEARDRALEAVRYPRHPGKPQVFERARNEATDLAAQLASRIPSVEIAISGLPAGTPPTVRIDSHLLSAAALSAPRKLNPGRHVISVSAPGFAPARVTVQLAERQNERVAISMTPGNGAEPEEPSTEGAVEVDAIRPGPEVPSGGRSHTLAYVAFGVGAAGLVTGAVTGVMALSKQSALESRCDTGAHACPEDARSELDAGRRLAWVSNIGFGVGIVGAGVGVASLLWPASNDAKPQLGRRPGLRVQPWSGTTSAGMVVGGWF
ncbi:MAG TPA: hypothetical protein PLI95_17860 [Polyangiaceae bacterium]|nr:hypothetical protein [Polyangiaceae bacterium]